jgi:redox-sensitive bicupin YhaK (pirin superfamily)
MDAAPDDEILAAPELGEDGRFLDTVVVPRTRDLGDGVQVRRALPCSARTMVGPFIFFDHIGPVVFRSGTGLDVRPHPHIGLAAVTYLFEGEILHRDSLGSLQPIRAGAVNWMTAGRGIVHSERTSADVREAGGRLFGTQVWLALPKDQEEVEPAFVHHAAATLPVLDGEGKRVRLIAGSLFGATSPVRTLSPMFYAEVALDTDALLSIPADHEERAAYVVDGDVSLDPNGAVFPRGQLLILKPGVEVTLLARDMPARIMLLGGEPMDGPRHLWWNFVSSSADRIEAAKADWKAGRFQPVPGETEFIPLPDGPPPPVRYP